MKLKQIVLACSVVLGVALIGGFVLSQPDIQTRTLDENSATDEQIVDAFLKIAIGSEHTELHKGGNFISKWNKNLSFGVIQNEEESLEIFIKEYLVELTNLTGLQINIIIDPPAEMDFAVYFVEDAEFNRVDKKIRGQGDSDSVNCLTYMHIHGANNLHSNRFKGDIFHASIGIRQKFTNSQKRKCIVEEIPQAMGLANDSLEVSPSNFNDAEGYEYLTWLDKLFLQILYHPKMKPGLSKSEAREVAIKILPEIRAKPTSEQRLDKGL